ncbi:MULTISPECIES: hypothetical protein [Streptomyces]|uniref:hypothetical protein n=1 Tax=Streptomyces TaxID=1883 RepID=UPI0015C5183D|nr:MULTISPECIES: hypothetical protein [Streptomyces]MDX3631331.1 hypothetical protein [Streptomyces europaeiscabiei]MDX3647811.1 hypothetical protein [Streptomyces europaeiscabiei]WUD32482.1 hypothetical protein OG858_14280 [Streptomyces europaeiscabiei]
MSGLEMSRAVAVALVPGVLSAWKSSGAGSGGFGAWAGQAVHGRMRTGLSKTAPMP